MTVMSLLTATALVVPEIPLGGRVVAVVLAIVFLIAGVRLLRSRVATERDGISYHGLLVKRFYPWQQVSEIVYCQIDEKFIFPVICPCVTGTFNNSGFLNAFAGYELIPGRKNRRVMRQSQILEEARKQRN